MRNAIVLFLSISCLSVQAQWVPQQAPMQKKDFEKIASKKYTVAFEYETTGDIKVLKSVVEYGAQGLPAAYYEKGTIDNGDSVNLAETIYKFDGTGRVIRESHKETEADSWDKVYTYSKNGKLQKTVGLHIDPSTTNHTYDAMGKLVKTYTTVRMAAVNDNGDATGKAADFPSQRENFLYDKAGNLKEVVVYRLMNADDPRKPAYKTLWTYNDKRQLTKLEFVDSDGTVYNAETYAYDDDGMLIRKTVKDRDDAVQTFQYEYCTTCKQSWMN